MKVLEANEYDIMKLLAESQSAYRVPLYQRPYAWREDQWDDLYDDISNLENDETHFLGSFVIVEEQKTNPDIDYFQIVDGQQRFATILIWLSAIRDIALEENEPLANQIDNKFLFVSWLEGREEKKIPKIQLGELDIDAFGNVLNNRKKNGEHLIYDCYNFFKDRTSIEDYYKLIGDVTLVRINTADHLNAFRLFETMNDRGLELSSADLIKNFILMKIANNKKIFAEVIDEWNDMYEKIRDLEPVTFIRRYFLSTFKGKISETKLYEALQNKLKNKNEEEILSFVKDLNDKSSIYKMIHESSFKSNKVNEKLNKLHLVEVAPSFTLLLKISPLYENGELNEADFIEIMDLIEKLHIRGGIANINSNRLDQIYNDICIDIPNLAPEKIVDYIKKIFTIDIKRNADDETFKRSFIYKKFSPNAKRTKYILWRLSSPTGETIPNLINLQTEHIMPQRLSNHWKDYLKEKTSMNVDKINAVKKEKNNLIGNLSIIKGEWNQRMSNKPFYEKKKEYILSEFSLNQDLANNYDSWTFDTIDDRTKKLADLALDIWSWDYKYSESLKPAYWITTIRDRKGFTAEEALAELLLKREVYTFGDTTPGKNSLIPGDHICFYIKGKGIGADAIVDSKPENNSKNIIEGFESFPWVFNVKNVNFYTENPIEIGKDIKNYLDFFKDKSEGYSKGYFLQHTHEISEKDFKYLLNRKKDDQSVLIDN